MEIQAQMVLIFHPSFYGLLCDSLKPLAALDCAGKFTSLSLSLSLSPALG